MVTPEAINFMATHARGLICLAMTGERLDQLELGAMVLNNTAPLGTAFTVSIDARGRGVTTGISSYDRAQTILAAVDPRSRPEDLARPGHVFPLRSRPDGVLERRGQTEASVDLARLAGLHHAAVICEIMNRDGSTARGPDLTRFCSEFGFTMVTVAQLVRYRLEAKLDHRRRVPAMSKVRVAARRLGTELTNASTTETARHPGPEVADQVGEARAVPIKMFSRPAGAGEGPGPCPPRPGRWPAGRQCDEAGRLKIN